MTFDEINDLHDKAKALAYEVTFRLHGPSRQAPVSCTLHCFGSTVGNSTACFQVCSGEKETIQEALQHVIEAYPQARRRSDAQGGMKDLTARPKPSLLSGSPEDILKSLGL